MKIAVKVREYALAKKKVKEYEKHIYTISNSIQHLGDDRYAKSLNLFTKSKLLTVRKLNSSTNITSVVISRVK